MALSMWCLSSWLRRAGRSVGGTQETGSFTAAGRLPGNAVPLPGIRFRAIGLLTGE